MISRRDILKMAPAVGIGFASSGLILPSPAMAHESEEPSLSVSTDSLDVAVTEDFLGYRTVVEAKTWTTASGLKVATLADGQNKIFAKAIRHDAHTDAWVEGKHTDWYDANLNRRRLTFEEDYPSMRSDFRGIGSARLVGDPIRISGAQYQHLVDVNTNESYIAADLYIGNLGWRRIVVRNTVSAAGRIANIFAQIQDIGEQLRNMATNLGLNEAAILGTMVVTGGSFAPAGTVAMVMIAAIAGASLWFTWNRQAVHFRRLRIYWTNELMYDPNDYSPV